jgi:hypothetical protein
MTLSFVPTAAAGRPGHRGRPFVDGRPPSLWIAVTTWSPLVVPTDATCGTVNTAAGAVR